jgi:hypothetical protein
MRSQVDESFIDQLWDLVDDWRKLADDKVIHMPFISERPRTAHGQGLNTAADQLSAILLGWVP